MKQISALNNPIGVDVPLKKSNRRKTVNIMEFRFGLFVKWHINLCGLFNVKAILKEGQ